MRINKQIDYKRQRQKAFEQVSVGDQLDAIISAFAILKAEGVNVGKKMSDLIDYSENVKDKYKSKQDKVKP